MTRDNLVIAETKIQLARSLIAESRSLASEALNGEMREQITVCQTVLDEWELHLRSVLDGRKKIGE